MIQQVFNAVASYALAHQDLIIGFVAGYALSHIPQAVAFLFHQSMRVPFVRAAIVADPAKAKQVIDAIHDELDKDIDAEAEAAKKDTPTNP